jgi:hypothetical protein
MVAIDFNVRPAVVMSLVKKTKKNKEFLQELGDMDEFRNNREQKIIDEAELTFSDGKFINNALQIVEQVKAKHGIDVDVKLVRKVFRRDLDLRY